MQNVGRWCCMGVLGICVCWAVRREAAKEAPVAAEEARARKHTAEKAAAAQEAAEAAAQGACGGRRSSALMTVTQRLEPPAIKAQLPVKISRMSGADGMP